MTPPTDSFLWRSYESEADYGLMRRLLVEILARPGLPVYATVGNLDWWRVAEDDPRSIYQTQLWFDGDRLIAFAWPIEGQVDILVHPDYPALHDVALAWSEAYFRHQSAEGAASPWEAWAFTGDAARIAALERRGYRRTERGLVLYTQPVPNPAPDPILPDGYTLRAVENTDESEIEKRVAVQRAAFESTWMTAERHARVRHSPTYRPELDIVAVAPDGEFAAFALLWFDEANRLGVFEPLGVAVTHQRLGLGRAIMAEGLRRLAAQGARTACVETGLDNHAARRLYEAAGFAMLDIDYAWLLPSASSA
jgi:ribosomal protein S18 acetylase RimI-like enzyme